MEKRIMIFWGNHRRLPLEFSLGNFMVYPSSLTFRSLIEHTAINCDVGVICAHIGKSDVPLTAAAFMIHGFAIDALHEIALWNLGEGSENRSNCYKTLTIGYVIVNTVAMAIFFQMNIIGWRGVSLFGVYTAAILIDLNIHR
jgi:hypothetical protein